MTNRIAALSAAFILSAATLTSATAAPRTTTWTGLSPYEVETTGSFGVPAGGLYGRNPATCPMSSAAEGNAKQQNFPVMQYGQTAGGNRC